MPSSMSRHISYCHVGGGRSALSSSAPTCPDTASPLSARMGEVVTKYLLEYLSGQPGNLYRRASGWKCGTCGIIDRAGTAGGRARHLMGGGLPPALIQLHETRHRTAPIAANDRCRHSGVAAR
jgi:hypothetical protein